MELPSLYFIFKLTLLSNLSSNVGSPLVENFSGCISCTKIFTDPNLGSTEFPHYFISFHLSSFLLYLLRTSSCPAFLTNKLSVFKGMQTTFFSRQNMCSLNFISDVNNVLHVLNSPSAFY